MHAKDRMAAAGMVSPLTLTVRGVLEWAFPAGAFDELCAVSAPQLRPRKLTVDTLAWLLIEVVSGTQRSVHAAYRADQASPAPTLPASPQALYAKLGRLAPEFSTAVVRQSGARLMQLLAQAGQAGCPGWKGYRVRLLDGTDLGGTEHRLKVLRKVESAGLPGRFVVEYDLATGLVVDAVASEDAYASERTLAQAIIARAEANDLFVADRYFCTTAWMFGVARRQGKFVVREYSHLRIRDWKPLQAAGSVAGGTVWQQATEVEDRGTGQRQRLRRIVIRLETPTRDGEREVRLLTNLPARIAATRIAELYRQRWTIEQHFNFLKNCLHGEVASLGRPRAAIFALCMAMATGNALSVLRRLLASRSGVDPTKLSGYYLADEIAANYRSIDRLIPEEQWQQFAEQSDAEFWQWCITTTQAINIAAFRTSPRGPKKPPPKRASGRRRKHYSTHRLLNEAHQRC